MCGLHFLAMGSPNATVDNVMHWICEHFESMCSTHRMRLPQFWGGTSWDPGEGVGSSGWWEVWLSGLWVVQLCAFVLAAFQTHDS